MLFRTPVVVAALFATLTFAAECGPGQHRKNNGNCVACDEGSISAITSPDGRPSYKCTDCPAGWSSDASRVSCVKCDPGFYNPVAGGACHKCRGGTFNNVSGAKSCCSCCSGWYSDSDRKFCHQCPSDEPYSAPGSNQRNDCTVSHSSYDPAPVSSCVMLSDNVCPNTTGSGPVGSPIARKKRDTRCPQGFTACARFSGRGGFDCVDTENDTESCGGCRDLDGTGTGADCTAIEGVSVTRCVKRSCVVDSCRKGWAKSLDGTSCVLVSHSNHSASSDGLHAQDPEASRKRTSSAKRSIRGKIF